jgi:hypothetical protein
MKKPKKKQGLPKRILQGIVKDILVLMEEEDSYPAALEVLEQLPEEAQVLLMEDLSGLRDPRLAQFLWLVKEECDGQIRTAAEKALSCFSLEGIEIKPSFLSRPDFHGEFLTALATPTRLTGRVDLIIAWNKPDGCLDVQYFHLRFGRDGIKEYIRVSDLSRQSFACEENTVYKGLVPVSLAEAVYLLKEAYWFNQVFRSRPARGITQYRYLLDGPAGLDDKESQNLALRLSEGGLSPEMVVNAVFIALRNFDWGTVYDLLSAQAPHRVTTREKYLSRRRRCLGLFAQTAFLKSRIKRVEINGRLAEVEAYLIIDQKETLYRVEYSFKLENDGSQWLVRSFRQGTRARLEEEDPDNPLNFDVYCMVYDCDQYVEIISLLDATPEVEFVGEFPLGVHYRWLQQTNPLSEGVDVTAGIYGELIVTDAELIIFSREEANTARIGNLFEERLEGEMAGRKQNYFLSASLVYAMFGGEFEYFEELLEELGVEVSEGPIRAFTATYQVKNREKVIDRIKSFEVLELEVPGSDLTYHEFVQVYEDEGARYGEGFIAEYKFVDGLLDVGQSPAHRIQPVVDYQILLRNITHLNLPGGCRKTEDVIGRQPVNCPACDLYPPDLCHYPLHDNRIVQAIGMFLKPPADNINIPGLVHSQAIPGLAASRPDQAGSQQPHYKNSQQ